ncbi:MAG: hypothetical protein J3Q66DRAFT_397728 [Benniella sp.]|nr:MAG: hypothetical protein J3Q66DRAFT_397728 [Benniella sp.]
MDTNRSTATGIDSLRLSPSYSITPRKKSFAAHDNDLKLLQQAVELRLAEIALCERDGSRAAKREMYLIVSRQVYWILHFFCVVIRSGQFENKILKQNVMLIGHISGGFMVSTKPVELSVHDIQPLKENNGPRRLKCESIKDQRINPSQIRNQRSQCTGVYQNDQKILITKTCITINTGEIASTATKEDIHVNEMLLSTVTQSGGRKTDISVLAKEVSRATYVTLNALLMSINRCSQDPLFEKSNQRSL